MNIYVGARQSGKTIELIRLSARTGATIAVATYQMAEDIKFKAKLMDLEIPEPVTYAEIFRNYGHNKPKRYLVDEAQMLLRQLNVDVATVTDTYIHDLKGE